MALGLRGTIGQEVQLPNNRAMRKAIEKVRTMVSVETSGDRAARLERERLDARPLAPVVVKHAADAHGTVSSPAFRQLLGPHARAGGRGFAAGGV